jgi:hypothetical protein
VWRLGRSVEKTRPAAPLPASYPGSLPGTPCNTGAPCASRPCSTTPRMCRQYSAVPQTKAATTLASEQRPVQAAELLSVDMQRERWVTWNGKGRQGGAPIGPQLQLLHGVFQGHQVPDVEGHGVAEVLRCWVCTSREAGAGQAAAALAFYQQCLCDSAQRQITKIGDVYCPPNGLAVLPHIVAVGGLQATGPVGQCIAVGKEHAACNQ